MVREGKSREEAREGKGQTPLILQHRYAHVCHQVIVYSGFSTECFYLTVLLVHSYSCADVSYAQ